MGELNLTAYCDCLESKNKYSNQNNNKDEDVKAFLRATESEQYGFGPGISGCKCNLVTQEPLVQDNWDFVPFGDIGKTYRL